MCENEERDITYQIKRSNPMQDQPGPFDPQEEDNQVARPTRPNA
jgi:hypothetical protein